MNRKINGYTAEFLKRQAKNIKKDQDIPYLQALNKAAISAGFTCWDNFVNKSKEPTIRNIKIGNQTSKLIPTNNQSISSPSNEINPYRKLLIAGTNELLRRGLISLIYEKQPKISEDGYVLVDDLLGYTAAILWNEISYQELRISVWWKYNHSLHP